MMNPATLMKFVSEKDKFAGRHPKFVAFFGAVFSGSVIEEGTVIEITVTKPGEEPMTTNMKVQREDLEMVQTLKELASK